MKQTDNHTVTIHDLPIEGEYGEFGSEKGVYYNGRVVEDYSKMKLKKSWSRQPRNPIFALGVFAIAPIWFSLVTDWGKTAIDDPRDRTIQIYKSK